MDVAAANCVNTARTAFRSRVGSSAVWGWARPSKMRRVTYALGLSFTSVSAKRRADSSSCAFTGWVELLKSSRSDTYTRCPADKEIVGTASLLSGAPFSVRR